MEKVLRLSVRGQWPLSAGRLGAHIKRGYNGSQFENGAATIPPTSTSSTKFFGTSPRKITEKLS